MGRKVGICEVGGCGVEGKITRGKCNTHYQKWYNARPRALPGTIPRDEIRFNSNCVRRGECLIWVGPKTKQGYGQISADGRQTRAHRYAWERVHGPIPENMLVDHRCHTMTCVEVRHLRLVTHKQNQENRAGKNSNNSSGYLNVYRDKKTGRWYVKVLHHGKQYYGGYFADIDKANEAAIALRNKLFTHNDLDRN